MDRFGPGMISGIRKVAQPSAVIFSLRGRAFPSEYWLHSQPKRIGVR
jgi:hypothetical protein